MLTVALGALVLGCSSGAATAPSGTSSTKPPTSGPSGPTSAAAATCDIKTEAGAKALYEKLTGRKVGEACITRHEGFEKFVEIGSMVPDAGCMDEIWINECVKAGPNDTKWILQAAGWKTTDDKGRIKLARAWLTPGPLLWELADHQKKHFESEKKTFTAPVVAATNGSLRIEGWFDRGHVTIAGENPKYERGAILFDADGNQSYEDMKDAFEPKR